MRDSGSLLLGAVWAMATAGACADSRGSRAPARVEAKPPAPPLPVLDKPRTTEAETSSPSNTALFASGNADATAAVRVEPASEVRRGSETAVDPRATEEPSDSAIRAVLQANRHGLRDCVADAWRRGERLSGTMRVELTIDRRGRVRAARPLTAKFRGTVLAGCAMGRIKEWRFPPWRARTQAVVILPYLVEAVR